MILSLKDELAEIRATMARLAAREAALIRQCEAQPQIPVFRPGWPIRLNAMKALPTARSGRMAGALA